MVLREFEAAPFERTTLWTRFVYRFECGSTVAAFDVNLLGS
ncbi:hypothetical protein [Haloferax sp. CBA1148]|nr:hypothetical protein [Haloferax sp. CBA1148]